MIFYLCDGKDETCNKRSCYLNGGECRHTSNISNAKNFRETVGSNIIEEDLKRWLSTKEMGFLITCIMTSTSEQFPNMPRYNEKYCPDSGVKYEKLSNVDILNLIKKLGGDADDIDEFIRYLFKFA